ncbi:MAG: HetP family heterocyst commitment protein [Nostocaceae cyanobacterium]|nr:HetP family heterocyst commitment protein [Nostocaceae cyanobacterium]
MNYHVSSAQKNLTRGLNPEQFNQIVEAIAGGKYSWACLLILRFAGYNPLHFIPYRTYSRLMKENNPYKKESTHTQNKIKAGIKSSANRSNSTTKINDLDYVENTDEKEASLQGGNLYYSSYEYINDLNCN